MAVVASGLHMNYSVRGQSQLLDQESPSRKLASVIRATHNEHLLNSACTKHYSELSICSDSLISTRALLQSSIGKMQRRAAK